MKNKIILISIAAAVSLLLIIIGYKKYYSSKKYSFNKTSTNNREISLYKFDNHLEPLVKKYYTNPSELQNIIREWQLFNDKEDVQILNVVSSDNILIIHTSGFFKNSLSALDEYKVYASLYKTFKKLGYEKIYLFLKDDLEKPSYLNTHLYSDIEYMLFLNKKELKTFFLKEIENYNYIIYPYFGNKKYGNALLDRYEKSFYEELTGIYSKNGPILFLNDSSKKLNQDNPCILYCSFSISDSPYIGLFVSSTDKKLIKPFMDTEKINGVYKSDSSYLQNFLSYFLKEKGHQCINLEIQSDLFNQHQCPVLYIHINKQSYEDLKIAFRDVYQIITSINA